MVEEAVLKLRELVQDAIKNGTSLEGLNELKSIGELTKQKWRSLHDQQIGVYGTSLSNKNILLSMLRESKSLSEVDAVETRFSDIVSAGPKHIYRADKEIVSSAILEAKWPHLVNEINNYLKEIAALPVLQEHVDTLEGMLSKYREVLPQNHIDRVQKVIEIKKSKLEP